jgi:hypothetical protein
MRRTAAARRGDLGALIKELEGLTDPAKRKAATAKHLLAIEKLVGPVPDDLKRLYAFAGNLDALFGEPEDSQQWLSPATGVACTRDLRKYGAPTELFAISTDHGGNFACLHFGTGRVLDWDHETRRTRALAPDLAGWLKDLVRAVARAARDSEAIARDSTAVPRAGGFPENPRRLVPVPSALLAKVARESYGGAVRSVAFLPDGRIAVAHQNSASLVVPGRKKEEFAPEVGNRLAVDPGRNRIIGADFNKLAIVDAKGEPTLVARHDTFWEHIGQLRVSAAGIACIAGTQMQLWDVTGNGKLLGWLKGHEASVRALRFSPDGAVLVSGDEAGTLCVWDVRKRRLLRRAETKQEVTGLDFSTDGSGLVAGFSSGKVAVLDPGSLKEKRAFSFRETLYDLRIAPTGALVAIGGKTLSVTSPEGKVLAKVARKHNGLSSIGDIRGDFILTAQPVSVVRVT